MQAHILPSASSLDLENTKAYQYITWTSGIAANRAATLSEDFSHSLHNKLWAGISPYLITMEISIAQYKDQETISLTTVIILLTWNQAQQVSESTKQNGDSHHQQHVQSQQRILLPKSH